MTNKRRFFAMLLALVMSISCLTVTASAEANPPSDDVIIWTSEPTEPQETRPAETQPPATEPAPTTPPPTEPEPETNAIVRDLLYHEETNKQFITVETRSKHRQRDGIDPIGGGGNGFRVEIEGKGIAVFTDKIRDARYGFMDTIGQVYHKEVDILTISGVGIAEGGEFGFAGTAPGCPKIDDDRLAHKI